jgi:hypothetical protein
MSPDLEGDPLIPEPDPVRAHVRRQRILRQLPPDATCLFCHERDPDLLSTRKGYRRLLEEHHVAAFDNDPELTVVLCRNCHAKVTAGQFDAETFVPGGAESDLERVAFGLRSVGVFFAMFSRTMFVWADRLLSQARNLDENSPGWRNDHEER